MFRFERVIRGKAAMYMVKSDGATREVLITRLAADDDRTQTMALALYPESATGDAGETKGARDKAVDFAHDLAKMMQAFEGSPIWNQRDWHSWLRDCFSTIKPEECDRTSRLRQFAERQQDVAVGRG